MSKQLFINNATAVPAAAGGTTNPSAVAEARIAAFDADDFASGTLDLTAPFEGKHLQFVQGGAGDNDSIISSVINLEDIEGVYERPYVAPTAQATTVVPETGTGTATIRIVETSAGFKPHKRVTISVVLDGKSKAQITDAFVDQFNASEPQFVTASNGASDNLVLTADLEVSFETSLDEEAEDWDVSSVAPNFGSGTAEHVANLEEVAYGGNFPNRIYLPIHPPSYAADSTYDLFTIKVKTNTTSNIGGPGQEYQELILAVQATATGIDLPVFLGFEEPSGA